ncbi:unnamed protein product [Diplocarpon coronariae]
MIIDLKEIISAELPDLFNILKLQMAFKAINDSVGLNSLILTLLVFGTYLRLIDLNPLAPSIIQRALAIQKAIEELRTFQARR